MDDFRHPAKRAAIMDTVVETDPSGRFARSNVILGKGASKTVYKAFDRIEGREVAWNTALVSGSTEAAHALLHTEVKVLKSLKHRNIMKFYASWVDDDHGTINFITEYFHSGTLKRHRLAHKSFNINPALLKRWAWQILQGLVYLHGHNPPVIHRDLKCDNIFIHGVTGEVKIGDLGLARMMEENFAMCHTCIGTPEFMAPELFNEEYNEKVDIYSFGMCLLELVTMTYPYSECKTACQIYRNVTQGIPPQALAKVEDKETHDFIEMCIRFDHRTRPSARQLVKCKFFDDMRAPSPTTKPFCVPSSPELALDESNLIMEGIQDSLLGIQSAPECFRPCMVSDAAMDEAVRDELLGEMGTPFAEVVSDIDGDGRDERVPYNKANSVVSCTDSDDPTGLKRQFSLTHTGSTALPFVDVINFELCFGGPGGTKKLMFSFDVLSDTVEDVGLELEEEYSLTPEETDLFTRMLKQELDRAMHSSSKAHGKPSMLGPSVLGTLGSVHVSMSLDDWTNNVSGPARGNLSGELQSGTNNLKSGTKTPPMVSFKINVEGNGLGKTSRTFFDASRRRRCSTDRRKSCDRRKSTDRRHSIDSQATHMRSGDHRPPRRSFGLERNGVWNNLVHHLKGPGSLHKHSVTHQMFMLGGRTLSQDSVMIKAGMEEGKESRSKRTTGKLSDGRQQPKGDKRLKRSKSALRLSNVSITPVLNQVRLVAGAVKHIKAAAVILCRNSLEGKRVFFEIRGKPGKQAKGKTEPRSAGRTEVCDSARETVTPETPDRGSIDMDGCSGQKKAFFGSFRRVAKKAWRGIRGPEYL